MRSVPDILFDVAGQQLLSRALEGQPSSATFKVFNDYAGDDDTALFSGTATIDSVATTVSATSGAGEDDPQRINLTSTTGIERGRKYLLSEGQRQVWVNPIEVGTGYIRARQVLRGSFSTSATFVGTTMIATVDSTFAATEGYLSDMLDPNPDYRVRWDYVVDGDECVSYSFFDLVRANVRYQVDISDLSDAAPGLEDSLPVEHQATQGRELLERAWRKVQIDLGAIQIDTDAIRDDLLLDELVIAAGLVVLAIGGWKPLGYASVSEYFQVVEPAYNRMLEKNFVVVNSRRLGAGTDGGAERVEAQPVFAK